MKAAVGKYFFGRHRNMWGVWIYNSITENGSTGAFIKDVPTYEEVVIEVYRLNGWESPQTINRKF